MINQPAQPKNRPGENLPTEINNEQAKITYDTAEIATKVQCTVHLHLLDPPSSLL